MGIYDRLYKRLFGDPKMIKDLLLGFVKEDWVGKLDFGTLEKTNKSYVLEDLKERHDDIIWKVKWKHADKWMYVYLLLEFQTDEDTHMAARMLNYVSSLYMDLVESGGFGKKQKLPPVLPIVIYRGNDPWACSLEMEDLIEKPPGKLAGYTPKHKYLLLEEGKIDDAGLAKMKNAVAGLIKLEKSKSPMEAVEILATLLKWLQNSGDGHDSLRKSLYVFFLKAQKGIKMLSEEELGQLEHKKLEEVIPMWPERMEKLTEDLLSKGRVEGMEKGREEGQVILLAKQIEFRFGEMPSNYKKRLNTMTSEELVLLSKRIFQATDLGDLLGE